MHHVALLNGCHYLYTDQLGSVGAISKNDGTLVGELLRYEPFGDARGTQPSSDITDRGFTGHRENRDIGLTYMSARYYVGEIGRFASADTLVPDPQNPQSFNRFAYVNNNPLKYTDPSGHCAQYAGEDNEALAQCLDLWNQLGSAYLILQQLGGNGSQYPTDLMNQLLEMGTIKDIQGYIDTIGSAATRLREAHYTSMQSNCTAVGGSIACPPDGPGGAWPKYLPGDVLDEQQVIGFVIKAPISLVAGKGISVIAGRFVEDRIAVWLLTTIIRRTVVNPTINVVYDKFYDSPSAETVSPGGAEESGLSVSMDMSSGERWRDRQKDWLAQYGWFADE